MEDESCPPEINPEFPLREMTLSLNMIELPLSLTLPLNSLPIGGLPPNRTSRCSTKLPEPRSSECQFPGAGDVAEPSWLVSPPTLSSRREVKIMGLAAVPLATRRPCTKRELPNILMTTPGRIVSVAPGDTEMVVVMM